MTILIHSRRDDVHAAAVHWGLARLGAPCLFWPAGEFPGSQALSASISGGEDRHALVLGGRRHDLAEIRTVWNRRKAPPSVRPDLDGRDLEFALEQSRQHFDSFMSTACPSALWVNRPEVASAEVQKIAQLRAARQVGLAIPATLFSNDPDEIRAFFEREGGDVVYKPYKMGVWTGEGSRRVFVNYTTSLSEADVQDRDSLAAAPGIFQRRVEKAFELRVTLFGDEIVAVRLNVPADGAVDWRAHPKDRLRVSPAELPDSVADRCRDYMALCGLAFCGFDFIVTEAGEHVFLEANQMGQFLWVEEKLPEIPMLDIMCAFLRSGDRGFRWDRRDTGLRFADFLGSLGAAKQPRPGPSR